MTGYPPWGHKFLNRLCLRDSHSRNAFYIFLLTFLCYACYHASRKPISIVKGVLHTAEYKHATSNTLRRGWAPFDQENWSQLIGGLEYSYLIVYAISMVSSGYIAERTDLRMFLAVGMFISGLMNVAFACAYYLDIHSYTYFMVVQVLSGIFQASGWPAVVTLMGNWWGKRRRGFIMGMWNAHTSIGNILGSVLAGQFVQSNWGASFAVPGLILLGGSVVVYASLVDHPDRLGLPDSAVKSPHPKEFSPGPTHSLSEPCLHRRNSKADSDVDVKPTRSSRKAITVCEALSVPNVLAYSVLLFFAKLVSYTFLYWLPNYLAVIEANRVNAEQAANLSVLFDLGGIVGGVLAGLLSDSRNPETDSRIIWRRSVTCAVMLLLAAPSLLLYQQIASATSSVSLALLFFCGALVNGPYALITTAVAADLGTQPSLLTRTRALATITAIIDGTGSFGAALGPFLTGLLVPLGWYSVFTMLIIADLLAWCVAMWVAFHTRRGYISLAPVEKDLFGI